MQNKIDRLIINGNHEFSEQRNVVASLIEYSRCLDLFEFMDRTYEIQVHELLVRIAICYDILGNFGKTIEFLNKALNIVPNVASLILYKSVLLQTLGKTDEAQKILVKYKQLSGKKNKDLYETFRLVFYYSMQLEKEVLLREINKYLEKYDKNAVVLYLRAMICLELSNSNANISNSNISQSQSSKNAHQSEFYLKYEADLKDALSIEPQDTEFLIKDGITNENLTKLFFMILPDMDYYQPKSLVNYKSFHSGLKIFYVIMKAVKMFRIKVEKKKLKQFYSNKLKLYRKKLENSKSNCDISDNSNTYSNNSYRNLENQSENKDSTSDKLNINEGSSVSANTQSKTVITGNNTSDLVDNKDLKENSESNSGTLSDSRNKIIKAKLKQTKHLNSERTGSNVALKSKNPTIVNIKNNVEKANTDDIINEIKKEYEMKVKSLYKTVWLFNLRMNDNINLNFDVDIDTNFFIKHKYYAPFNLKENIISGVKQNIEYKNHRNISADIDKCSPNSMIKNYSKNQWIIAKKNSNQIVGSMSSNNLYKFPTLKNEEPVDLSVSEINPKAIYCEEPETISFTNEINFFENKNNNAINNLRKFEKDKLKLQKLTTEVIKNEVLNTKKFIHRPSPRMDFFKMSANKFISSKEKKNTKDGNTLVDDKNNVNPSNTNNVSNNLTNNSNFNSNNPTNKSDNGGIVNQNNGNLSNSNSEHTKTQIGGPATLRKSIEINKIKINEDLLKKGNTKPIVFKNLPSKNNTNKLVSINKKYKLCESGNKEHLNLKTNENI